MIDFTWRLDFNIFIKGQGEANPLPLAWGVKVFFFFHLSPKLNLVNTTGDCPTYRVQRHSACGWRLVVNSFPKRITPRPGFEPQTQTPGLRSRDRSIITSFMTTTSHRSILPLELLLLRRKTYSCSTIRTDRKGWPKNFSLTRDDGGGPRMRQIGNLVATFWYNNWAVNVFINQWLSHDDCCQLTCPRRQSQQGHPISRRHLQPAYGMRWSTRPVPFLLSSRTQEQKVVAVHDLVPCAGCNHQRIPLVHCSVEPDAHHRVKAPPLSFWTPNQVKREWKPHEYPPHGPKEDVLPVPKGEEEKPPWWPGWDCLQLFDVSGAPLPKCMLLSVPQRQ